ncbi:MAG TPA: hypothetical protein DCY55_11730 [Gammaproteobacteria bacterium]|jgi:hypothetical protein|nr:hypothetical protein [Gammaproteobacteria bacterium]
MKRFTAYRDDMDTHHATHNSDQKNPEGEAQYEGIIFTDGTCAIRWLTAAASTSVWASFCTAMKVHGHPEYGTRIVFHDEPEPLPWDDDIASKYETGDMLL